MTVVRDTGLFNPHTMHGDIVVDGIVTSVYTTAVAPALVCRQGQQRQHGHRLKQAHAALWPVRMLYSLGYDIINGAFDEGSELIASLTPRGKDKY